MILNLDLGWYVRGQPKALVAYEERATEKGMDKESWLDFSSLFLGPSGPFEALSG